MARISKLMETDNVTIDPILFNYDDDNEDIDSDCVEEDMEGIDSDSSNADKDSNGVYENRVNGDSERVDDAADRPAKRHKRHAHPAANDYERIDKPLLRKLSRKLRWMYLCRFNKKGWEKIAEEIFDITDRDGWQFTQLRLRIQDTFKAWKSNTLKKMVEHVHHEKVISRSKDDLICMGNCSDRQIIFNYFLKTFNPDKLYTVFYWLKPVLEWDTTSEYGKWYIKNLYANLAAKIKIYDDLKEKNKKAEADGTWRQILKFWDRMAEREEYKDIDRGCFSEKQTVSQPLRTVEELDEDLFFSEAPKKSTTPSISF